MGNNKKNRALCLALLILLLVPLLGMLVFGASEAVSNERLAAKPRLARAGKLNLDVFSETADYFAGRFFGRPALITANSAVEAAVFGESASQDVVLGKDGWLFYADTLEDFQGTNPMTSRELFCAARNLSLMQEYFAREKTAFLFVCAPNKNTIYPEYMPRQYPKTDAKPDLDRLEEELIKQDVSFCNLRETLTGREALTYYKTDSHWNSYGSHLAGLEILSALGKEAGLEDDALSMQPHLGDLHQMLYPASGKEESAPALSRARTFSYVGAVRGADDQLFETTSAAEGTLFVFRDSFGNALHEDLAEQFGQAAFSRAMPYDCSQVKGGTDAVIVELAQRNLRWLASRPPLFPASEREAPKWETEASEQVSVQVQSGTFDGLSQYRGSFAQEPDADAQVFAFVDGAWYEACLTEDGFQLLAPEGSELAVVTSVNGAWTRFEARLES